MSANLNKFLNDDYSKLRIDKFNNQLDENWSRLTDEEKKNPETIPTRDNIVHDYFVSQRSSLLFGKEIDFSKRAETFFRLTKYPSTLHLTQTDQTTRIRTALPGVIPLHLVVSDKRAATEQRVKTAIAAAFQGKTSLNDIDFKALLATEILNALALTGAALSQATAMLYLYASLISKLNTLLVKSAAPSGSSAVVVEPVQPGTDAELTARRQVFANSVFTIPVTTSSLLRAWGATYQPVQDTGLVADPTVAARRHVDRVRPLPHRSAPRLRDEFAAMNLSDYKPTAMHQRVGREAPGRVRH